MLSQLAVHVPRHPGHPGGVGLPGAFAQQSQRALVGDVLFGDGVVEDRGHAGGLACRDEVLGVFEDAGVHGDGDPDLPASAHARNLNRAEFRGGRVSWLG
ncbi:hypothetical protein OHB01_26020 [Microbispora hainanensis]|uniref:hypothetical protein n=1 Tax=Microbispora hainanensis TaxID=568844 RepID=UPI002E27D428|nr:hypothetical protein [Microbispora hainanensis]